MHASAALHSFLEYICALSDSTESPSGLRPPQPPQLPCISTVERRTSLRTHSARWTLRAQCNDRTVGAHAARAL
jgi:hypothetical protein